MRLVGTVLLAAVALSGCAADPPSRPGPGPVATGPSPAAPAAPVTASPATPSVPPVPDPPLAPTTAGTALQAVYWLGNAGDPRGPRLYREFFQAPIGGDPVRDAVQRMLDGQPADPDYTSLWADGTAVRAVRVDGTTATVDLTGRARESGGGSQFEQATAQQLVHTVTAADPAVTAVRLLIDGKPTDTLWGTVGLSEPLTRDRQEGILGPVWLDLADGAALPGGRFGGTATVYEATVDWDFQQNGRTVRSGFSNATVGAPGRGDWTGQANVPPGTYVLRAYETSAGDGSVVALDTKTVVVR